MRLAEIERLAPSDYPGGKNFLSAGPGKKIYRPLPGGSGLYYSIEGSRSPTIKLWDPRGQKPSTEREPRKQRYEFWYEYNERLEAWRERQAKQGAGGRTQPQLIGKLELYDYSGFPMPGAVRVHSITVDEDYRGQGLAKALYGIVLSIMRRPLIAGDAQTPGGRRNWVSLASIPGAEVRGWVALSSQGQHDNVDRIGGQFIGQKGDLRFFSFDLTPNAGGKELQPTVKTRLTQLYGRNIEYLNGIYAVWRGK